MRNTEFAAAQKGVPLGGTYRSCLGTMAPAPNSPWALQAGLVGSTVLACRDAQKATPAKMRAVAFLPLPT